MQRAFSLALFFSIAALSAIPAQTIEKGVFAGDTTRLHQLRTHRGDEFFGTLLSKSADSIYFKLQSGLEIRLASSDVASILPADVQASEPTAFKPHRQPAKDLDLGAEYLLFSPTGFHFSKGRSEYRNTLLLVNQIDIGASNHVSIGATIILPALAGIHAKAGIRVAPATRLAAGGAFYFSTTDGAAATHLYGVWSQGSAERFVNLTAGMVGELGNVWRPVVSGGGAYRFDRNWRIMGDIGYIANGRKGLFFPSLSFSWLRASGRVDFGMLSMNVLPIPVPYVRYALRF